MSSQLLLFPERRPHMAAPTPNGQARAQVIAMPRPTRLRRCVIDAPHNGSAGRMVLSGRFADVCAALDQMVANG